MGLQMNVNQGTLLASTVVGVSTTLLENDAVAVELVTSNTNGVQEQLETRTSNVKVSTTKKFLRF